MRYSDRNWSAERVVAAPFIGHLFSPVFGYLLARFRPGTDHCGHCDAFPIDLPRRGAHRGDPVRPCLRVGDDVGDRGREHGVVRDPHAGHLPRQRTRLGHGEGPHRGRLASIASATLAGLFIDNVPATVVFAVATCVSLPGAIAFGRIRHDPPDRGAHWTSIRTPGTF